MDMHQRRAQIQAALDSVAQSEHAERHRCQRQVHVSAAGHPERHPAPDIGRSRQFFRRTPLLLDELGRRRAIAVIAEIISRRQRIVETELAVDGLRYLVGGTQLRAQAIGAGRETRGEQQHNPIPAQDLRAHQEQQDHAAERDDAREGHRVDRQVRNLTQPATPDYFVQSTALVSHLTIMPETYRQSSFCRRANSRTISSPLEWRPSRITNLPPTATSRTALRSPEKTT